MSAYLRLNDEVSTVRIEADGGSITIRGDSSRDPRFFLSDTSISLTLSPKNLDALEAAIKAARAQMMKAARAQMVKA